MCEDPQNENRPGVWMLNQRKNQMNNDANLFMVMGALHMLPVEHKQQALVTIGRDSGMPTAKLFQDQLKTYRSKIDRSTTDMSREAKARYTGKSAGSKDDMVIAFQLALTWGMAFLDDPDYVSKYNCTPECIVTKVRPELNELYN